MATAVVLGKTCTKCKRRQPLALFSPDRRYPKMLQSHCKPCKALGEKERRVRDGDRIRALDRERLRRNPEAKRAKDRKSKYGLSPAEFTAMLVAQDHRCAICRVDFSRVARGANIDHCHETGRVRALLCGPCNRGLEPIERPGFAEAARAHLDKYRSE